MNIIKKLAKLPLREQRAQIVKYDFFLTSLDNYVTHEYICFTKKLVFIKTRNYTRWCQYVIKDEHLYIDKIINIINVAKIKPMRLDQFTKENFIDFL